MSLMSKNVSFHFRSGSKPRNTVRGFGNLQMTNLNAYAGQVSTGICINLFLFLISTDYNVNLLRALNLHYTPRSITIERENSDVLVRISMAIVVSDDELYVKVFYKKNQKKVNRRFDVSNIILKIEIVYVNVKVVVRVEKFLNVMGALLYKYLYIGE